MNSAVCLLDIAAEGCGGKTAVRDEWRSVTYNELRNISRSIGTALLRAGSRRRPVIVYLPKSISALSCFMGAMYAGCPYVPVDAKIPMARLQKIIENLAPGHIITSPELAANLSACSLGRAAVCLYDELCAVEPDDALIDPSLAAVADIDPIYIMYTSGSTGTPKGVTIPHRGIIDYSEWVVSTFGYGEETVMASQAPFYFDNSTFDIYGTLRCMGTLILIPDALLHFPLKLPEFLADNGITSIFWVPTVMINVANSGALSSCSLPKLRVVAFAGEVMPNLQLNVWRRALPDCVYANLYGPTEITDVCCCYIVDRPFADHETLPIGRACRNMRLLILNENSEQAAAGEQGELCILGSGLALGYWNSPEITEKVFVQNPLNGEYHERLYRSGDLAYVNEEGLIIFLGRKDGQVKVKGNRIELGEVEAAARCVPGVENACALFDGEAQAIVLFVEAEETLPFRRFNLELKKYITAYMLPGRMLVMPKLPYTANGKIDRVTLRGKMKDEA